MFEHAGIRWSLELFLETGNEINEYITWATYPGPVPKRLSVFVWLMQNLCGARWSGLRRGRLSQWRTASACEQHAKHAEVTHVRWKFYDGMSLVFGDASQIFCTCTKVLVYAEYVLKICKVLLISYNFSYVTGSYAQVTQKLTSVWSQPVIRTCKLRRKFLWVNNFFHWPSFICVLVTFSKHTHATYTWVLWLFSYNDDDITVWHGFWEPRLQGLRFHPYTWNDQILTQTHMKLPSAPSDRRLCLNPVQSESCQTHQHVRTSQWSSSSCDLEQEPPCA